MSTERFELKLSLTYKSSQPLKLLICMTSLLVGFSQHPLLIPVLTSNTIIPMNNLCSFNTPRLVIVGLFATHLWRPVMDSNFCVSVLSLLWHRAVARILFQPRQWGEPGIWGRSPQRGPGAEPLVRGSGGEAPLKLKAIH